MTWIGRRIATARTEGSSLLNLNVMELTELPVEIADLASVRILHLNGNPLRIFPEVLLGLTGLEELHLHACQLREVPERIAELVNLRVLGLRGNEISRLPSGIALLPKLEEITIDGNPLPGDVLGISSRLGTGAVIDWIADRAARTIELRDAKVVVVGEGEAGKTSLVARLCTDEFVERPRTHGVEISEKTIGAEGESSTTTVRFWDFGGQDIYRSTQQFFYVADDLHGCLERATWRRGFRCGGLASQARIATRTKREDYPRWDSLRCDSSG